METDVKCPSGLKGHVRAIKVKDEKIFTDPKLLKSRNLTQEVCKRCWLETLDPGPYNFENGNIMWPKILQGDAFYLFFQLRRISYGDEYEFSAQCGNCLSTIPWEINFERDLIVKELPEKSLEAMKSDQPLEVKLENGTLIQFRLLFLEDDKKITNLQRSRELPRRYATMVARLISVEGVGDKHFDMVRFVENLDSGEADLLEEKMEAYDCGIDTSIEIICNNCLYSEVIDLPFDISFFRRRKKKKLNQEIRTE